MELGARTIMTHRDAQRAEGWLMLPSHLQAPILLPAGLWPNYQWMDGLGPLLQSLVSPAVADSCMHSCVHAWSGCRRTGPLRAGKGLGRQT